MHFLCTLHPALCTESMMYTCYVHFVHARHLQTFHEFRIALNLLHFNGFPSSLSMKTTKTMTTAAAATTAMVKMHMKKKSTKKVLMLALSLPFFRSSLSLVFFSILFSHFYGIKTNKHLRLFCRYTLYPPFIDQSQTADGRHITNLPEHTRINRVDCSEFNKPLLA